MNFALNQTTPMKKFVSAILATMIIGFVSPTVLRADGGEKKEKERDEKSKLPTFAKWKFSKVLAPDGSDRVFVSAVNNKGAALASYYDPVEARNRNFLVDEKNRTKVIYFNFLGGSDLEFFGVGMDDDQTIYGTLVDVNGGQHAVYWKEGKTKEVVFPNSVSTGFQTIASDGSALGYATRAMPDGSVIVIQFTWRKGVFTAAPIVPLPESGINAHNATGSFLVTSAVLDPGALTARREDYIYKPKRNLLIPIPPHGGLLEDIPQFIADTDVVYGFLYDPTGNILAPPISYGFAFLDGQYAKIQAPMDVLGTSLTAITTTTIAGEYRDIDFGAHAFIARKN
jgi:hypothetical protein